MYSLFGFDCPLPLYDNSYFDHSRDRPDWVRVIHPRGQLLNHARRPNLVRKSFQRRGRPIER